jgi:hypothetical protein
VRLPYTEESALQLQRVVSSALALGSNDRLVPLLLIATSTSCSRAVAAGDVTHVSLVIY